MRPILYLLACTITAVLVFCGRRKPVFSVRLESNVRLDSLPSGSGVMIEGDSAYIISDDAPYLFKYALKSGVFEKFLLPGENNELYRIEKTKKPDYEALAEITIDNKKYLLAFGSGSLKPFRDSLLLVALDDQMAMKKLSLTPVYSKMSNNDTLNIEGAVADDDNVYLMNRADNSIWEWDKSDFLRYVQSNGEHPVQQLTQHRLSLPAANGLSAALSGGCLLNKQEILFCASLENTKNWVDDGTIEGSYIGIYDLREKKVKNIVLLKDQQSKIVKDKVESIDIWQKVSDNTIKAIAVADNDDGSTKLMVLRVEFKD